MDIRCLLHNSSSESESSTLFSGLPYVIDPQPQDGRHLRLFDLHLHRLVAHTLQPHCKSSVHTFGMGLTATVLVSIGCCRCHATIRMFLDQCVLGSELLHSSI